MKANKIKNMIAICTLVFSTSVIANDMSFFITSAGPGDGADLGGLAGADAHCSKLAKSASAKKSDGKPT